MSTTSKKHPSKNGYVPLGAWISNWTYLFPWLAQASFNGIDSLEEELDSIKTRVLFQDYQTLGKMYYAAHSFGLTHLKSYLSENDVETLSLGDVFYNAANRVQQNLGNQAAIQEIYDALGAIEKIIYNTWSENSFLRNCELGMALIQGTRADRKTLQLYAEGTTPTGVYPLDNTIFDKKNYSVFKDSAKLLPLIMPDGDLVAFGLPSGILSRDSDRYNKLAFRDGNTKDYIRFRAEKTPDGQDYLLSRSIPRVQLYPIPFSAADGVDWRGMSFSTNVRTMKELRENLDALSEEFEDRALWSFNSDQLEEDWQVTDYYRQSRIKKQYIGLIEEIKTVF